MANWEAAGEGMCDASFVQFCIFCLMVLVTFVDFLL